MSSLSAAATQSFFSLFLPPPFKFSTLSQTNAAKHVHLTGCKLLFQALRFRCVQGYELNSLDQIKKSNSGHYALEPNNLSPAAAEELPAGAAAEDSVDVFGCSQLNI